MRNFQSGDLAYHKVFKVIEISKVNSDRSFDILAYENRNIKNVQPSEIKGISRKNFFWYKAHDGERKIGNQNAWIILVLVSALSGIGTYCLTQIGVEDSGAGSTFWSITSAFFFSINVIMGLFIDSNWKKLPQP